MESSGDVDSSKPRPCYSTEAKQGDDAAYVPLSGETRNLLGAWPAEAIIRRVWVQVLVLQLLERAPRVCVPWRLAGHSHSTAGLRACATQIMIQVRV